MVPTPFALHSTHSSRRFLALVHLFSQYALRNLLPNHDAPVLLKREDRPHNVKFIVFACLIPVLVLLSGVFAGLTLGYMSLDVTQLSVLSISGTP